MLIYKTAVFNCLNHNIYKISKISHPDGKLLFMPLTCGTKTNILRTKNITVVKVRRFQMVVCTCFRHAKVRRGLFYRLTA